MKGNPMAYKSELAMASMLKQMARSMEKEIHPDQSLTYDQAFWEVWTNRYKFNVASDKQEQQHNRIISIIGKDKLIREIDHQTLSYIKKVLMSEGLCESTTNRYFNLMATTMRYIRDNRIPDLIVPNFKAVLNPKAERQRETIVSRELEALLMKNSDHELADFLTVLLYTGMRFSEAWGLTYERSIDFASNKITLYSKQTKSKKPRTLPMPKKVKKVLFKRMGQVKPFMMSKGYYEAHFRQLKDRLGLTDPDLVLHAMRHSAVSRLIDLGLSLPVVQEFVGHANINTTRRYIHLNHSHLVEAAEALDRL